MLVTLIGYSLFTVYVVLGLVTSVAVGCELGFDANKLDNASSTDERMNHLLKFTGAISAGTIWPVYVGYQLVRRLLPKFLAWMDS